MGEKQVRATTAGGVRSERRRACGVTWWHANSPANRLRAIEYRPTVPIRRQGSAAGALMVP
jgi:hypothetical protein